MEDASDTIFEATTSMKILNHLTDKYDFDPVQPSNLFPATKEKYSRRRASAVDAQVSNKRRSVVGGFPLL